MTQQPHYKFEFNMIWAMLILVVVILASIAESLIVITEILIK